MEVGVLSAELSTTALAQEATVFVVDDDEAVCGALQWLLDSAGIRVELYCSAPAFLQAYQFDRPGCLLLDVRMPEMSGLELQTRLAEHQEELPIIFMTAYGTVPTAVRALRAGAMDFVAKPFNNESILERIDQALARSRRAFVVRAERERVASKLKRLTPREREVLKGMVAGKPNKSIAADLGLSRKTVETHRAKIMDKMQTQSLAQVVTMAITQRELWRAIETRN